VDLKTKMMNPGITDEVHFRFSSFAGEKNQQRDTSTRQNTRVPMLDSTQKKSLSKSDRQKVFLTKPTTWFLVVRLRQEILSRWAQMHWNRSSPPNFAVPFFPQN